MNIRIIMDILKKTDELDANDIRIQERYKCIQGRIYKLIGEELRFYIPKKCRWRMVSNYHDKFGHHGVEKTVKKMQERFWFPAMRKYIKNYIGSCVDCLYHKIPGGKKSGLLHSIDKVGIPFHVVHADHLGPFVKSAQANTYVLAFVDGFTKFCILRPVKCTKSITTARAFKEIIHVFGRPTKIITDLGTAFTGGKFEKMCRDLDIIYVRNATATPRANGQVERLNRSITPMLATLSQREDGRDWDQHVGSAQWSLNNTYHRAIGNTPFQLLFQYQPRDPNSSPIEDELYTIDNQSDIEISRKKALESIIRDQSKQQERFNAKRCQAKTFVVGDVVMIKRNPSAIGDSLKLQASFKGPYIITEILPYDRYRVQDIPEVQRTQRRYCGVVANEDVKMFGVPDDDDNHDEINLNVFDPDDDEDEQEMGGKMEERSNEETASRDAHPSSKCTKRRTRKPKHFDDYVMN